MMCSCWTATGNAAISKKVALALLILSVYGVLLVFVSSDSLSPRIIATIKHRYKLHFPWYVQSNNTQGQETNSSNRSQNSSQSLITVIDTLGNKSFPMRNDETNSTNSIKDLSTNSISTSTRTKVTSTASTNTTEIASIVTSKTNSSFINNSSKTELSKLNNKVNSSTSQGNGTDDPLIVLFTTFSSSPRKAFIYLNTIRMWKALKPWVKRVLYTNKKEINMTSFAKTNGWDVWDVPKSSKQGVPILRHMFLDAQKRYNATYYGYANGDILFTNNLKETLLAIKPSLSQMKQLLIVGRRTNYQLKPKQKVTTFEEINKFGKLGKQFSSNAQDYFISTRGGYPWSTIPDFVVGRVGYDNWLVVTALVKRMYTIDATQTVLALHQTGTDGNYAGHQKKAKGDTYINYGLAGKRFDYALGHVSCGQLLTRLQNGKPILTERTQNGCARVFKRYHVNPYLHLKRQKQSLIS